MPVVPSVIGMTMADARNALASANLVVGSTTQAPHATIPKGNISGMKPAAGEQVGSGSAVDLEKSTGPANVAVPNLIYTTMADARNALASANLVVGSTTQAPHATIPKGNISGMKPAAGEQVGSGSAVDLEESTGPIGAPANVTVPLVIGLTHREAQSLLTKSGLLVHVRTVRNRAVPVGDVISCSPPAGSVISPGKFVDLEVSTGVGFDVAANIPGITVAVIGVFTLIAMGVGLYFSDFLVRIGNIDTARGLITFLIAVTTVVTLLIMVLANIMMFELADEADQRFRRGNQLFTALIGILGTIIGYYFGSNHNAGAMNRATPAVAIATSSLPPASLNESYSTQLSASGGLSPLKWESIRLPPGLELDAGTGLLHGKLTAQPSGPFVVVVTDSDTPPHVSTQTLSLATK